MSYNEICLRLIRQRAISAFLLSSISTCAASRPRLAPTHWMPWQKLTSVFVTAIQLLQQLQCPFAHCRSHNQNADIVDQAQTLSSACTPQAAPTCSDITLGYRTLFPFVHSLTIEYNNNDNTLSCQLCSISTLTLPPLLPLCLCCFDFCFNA